LLFLFLLLTAAALLFCGFGARNGSQRSSRLFGIVLRVALLLFFSPLRFFASPLLNHF